MLFSAPTAATPVFVAIALALSVAFFFTFTLISFRHKLGGKINAALDKPLIQQLSAWIGFFGFFIGESLYESTYTVHSLIIATFRTYIFLDCSHVVRKGSTRFQ